MVRFHSSPEHPILNLQAIEIFRNAGYQIIDQAQKIQLSDRSTYIPDISAVDPKTGAIIFIEVERDSKKIILQGNKMDETI